MIRIFLFSLFFLNMAEAVIPVPANSNAIVDTANLLSPQIRAQLNASLIEFQKNYGPQIQVLTVPGLEGEPIENFSIRVTDQWKTGDKKLDNGLLLLIAAKDHKIRIEVGQGLEGNLPDALAGRIIHKVMVPYFKQNQFSEGIVAGLHNIAQALGGELDNAPHIRGQSKARSLFFLLILLLFIFSNFFGRRRGSSGFITGMVLGNLLGGGRHRGGGFGGGGFGGGGGGGFSGGGASGDW